MYLTCAGLAHCCHLKTVCTHLSGFVYSTIVGKDPDYDSAGLTPERWAEICENCANGMVGLSGDCYLFMSKDSAVGGSFDFPSICLRIGQGTILFSRCAMAGVLPVWEHVLYICFAEYFYHM